METMRLLLLLLTIWTTAADSAPAQQPPTLGILDLTVAANYFSFITNLRDVMSDNVLLCTMKKIGANPTPRYGYIDVKASGTQTITLAIDRTNLYVLGYRDKFNGNDRAFFFKDEFNNAEGLFPDAKGKNNRVKLGFTGQYTALGDRTKVPLGIKNFRTSITDIYGKAPDAKLIAQQKTFFLIAIQMVAEATRFKYISNLIPSTDFNTFTPDAKVTVLENGWDTLSTAIYNANIAPSGKCTLKVTPVKLQDKWTFNSVEEIADVVGILRAKGKRQQVIDY